MHRNRTAALTTALLALALALPATAGARTLTFILAGQSNMEGYGLPVVANQPDPRILEVNDDGTITPAVEPLSPGHGMGLGYPFARQLVAADPTLRVVLDMCAVGSTTIAQWQKGGTLYADCIAKAARAGAPVGGILFFQGEQDCTPELTPLWPAMFGRMVADFRADLARPSLPVVFGQIGTGPAVWGDYALGLVYAMEAAQASVALPGVAMVATSDLPYGTPELNGHFSPESYGVIGGRFAAAWSALRPPPVPDAPGWLFALAERSAALNSVFQLG